MIGWPLELNADSDHRQNPNQHKEGDAHPAANRDESERRISARDEDQYCAMLQGSQDTFVATLRQRMIERRSQIHGYHGDRE
jgi:hypothetical protein